MCPSSFLWGLGDSGPSSLTRRLHFYHFYAARPKGVFRGHEHPNPGPAETPGCELAGNSPPPRARLGSRCGDVTHTSVPSHKNGVLSALAKSAAGRVTLPGTVFYAAAGCPPWAASSETRVPGAAAGGSWTRSWKAAPRGGRGSRARLDQSWSPGPARAQPPRGCRAPGRRPSQSSGQLGALHTARLSAHLRRWQEAGPVPTRFRSLVGEKPLEVRSRCTSLSPDKRRKACCAEVLCEGC